MFRYTLLPNIIESHQAVPKKIEFKMHLLNANGNVNAKSNFVTKSENVPDLDMYYSGIGGKRSPSDRGPYPRMGNTDPEGTCKNGYPGGL